MIKENSVLFIRTDYKEGSKMETEQDIHDHMKYMTEITKNRYFVAGMFGDMKSEITDGAVAMILIEAQDIKEAQEISDNDPLIKRGFYRCELQQWNIMMVSDKAKK